MEVRPLAVTVTQERHSFSFGPHMLVQCQGRFRFPSELGGCAGEIRISGDFEEAPGLLSDDAITQLDMIPNTLDGTVYVRALDCTVPLYLTNTKHLAIRIDDWPASII